LARNGTSGWAPIAAIAGVECYQRLALHRRHAEAIGVGGRISEKGGAVASSWARPCRATVNSTSSGLIDG
jgi:hypothetical protein